MPRAAILAGGAVAAAWLVPQVGLAATMLAGAVWLVAIAGVRAAGRDRVMRILLVGLIGFAATGARLAPSLLGAPGGLASTLPDGRGPWTFAVEAIGSPRDGQQRATLGPPPGNAGSAGAPGVSIRVAATLPAYPAVVPGDIVVVEGSIRPPPDSPYGRYLARIGADGTLQARTLAVAASSDGPGRALERIRRATGDALAAVLPEPEAGLAAGILIGLRDLVDRDLAAAFTTAGVSHVVAISGWNIAIVAAAVAAFAGRLGRRRRSVVTVVAIVAYVVFAGASASVVRAGLMAGVVLLARESGRAGQAATALGWTVTLLLLADPGLVLDAGLQLSALATAGLIVWATPLTGALDRLGRGHLPAWLTENLGVSLAAQAATLPLILASFGRLSIIAPAVNLVVVPLVAPAMAAGLLALLAGSLVAVGMPWILGAVLAAPAWVLLRLTVGIVEAAALVPFASVALAAPLDLVTAAVIALLIIGAHRRYGGRGRAVADRSIPVSPAPPRATPARNGRSASPLAVGRWTRAAAMSLAVTVLIAGAVIAARPAGVARITILDVGQGDAILVEGSNGGRLLVDGGPDPNRLLVALDARLPPWDRRIDAVVLSHPHEDHVAGLARLLDRYRVHQVFEPGTRGPGPGYAAWLARLAGRDAPERLGLAAGDRLAVDEIALTVLWPIRGEIPLDPPDGGTGINNVSIVLLGAVGDRRFLLAGDVEEAIDPRLIAAGLPHLDLLKVAHHGSRTATTQAFVDAVRPRIAVASAGTGNPYGHPTKQTIERLRAAGAQVYRTDRDGSVQVTFGSAGLTVDLEGGRAAEAPRPPIGPFGAATVATRGAGSAAAFRCAIPISALVPEREPVRPPIARQPRPSPDRATVTVGYHRPDDGTRARGSRLPPALPGSPAVVRAARARRGRGRGVPRRPDRGRGDRRGSTAGGIGGAPPRRRQARPGERSGPSPAARPRLGRVAHQARAP